MFSGNVDKKLPTNSRNIPEDQRPQTLQHKLQILQAAEILFFGKFPKHVMAVAVTAF
jgi:hypothetical protein